MGLFHFIKQYNGIRFAAHCLGKLSALLVSYVSWRRSDQSGHGMLLHVFTHIDTHHILFIIE